jgi:hypothetical protein
MSSADHYRSCFATYVDMNPIKCSHRIYPVMVGKGAKGSTEYEEWNVASDESEQGESKGGKEQLTRDLVFCDWCLHDVNPKPTPSRDLVSPSYFASS